MAWKLSFLWINLWKLILMNDHNLEYPVPYSKFLIRISSQEGLEIRDLNDQ
jgi:hypothetical protein